jgi:hypothetical protein
VNCADIKIIGNGTGVLEGPPLKIYNLPGYPELQPPQSDAPPQNSGIDIRKKTSSLLYKSHTSEKNAALRVVPDKTHEEDYKDIEIDKPKDTPIAILPKERESVNGENLGWGLFVEDYAPDIKIIQYY